MPLSDKENEELRQAQNYDWPSIQTHLLEEAAKKHGQDDPYAPYWTTNEDGTRTLHAGLDSWWLRDYDDSKVIFQLPGISIMNTQPHHTDSACVSLRDAYGLSYEDDCDDCFTPAHLEAHIKRFPSGQFIAQRISGPYAGNCVGMASNMRTSRPPTAPILPWRDAIGDMTLGAHEPDGDWIYGVEMAVHSEYRGHGVGTRFHIARFALAKALNLRGVYLVGMLMGYRRQAGHKDVMKYGERVMAGEIKDPTVGMQMKRGYEPVRVVPDYSDEPDAGNAGVLLVWENPDYA